jgi:hypothetical protein
MIVLVCQCIGALRLGVVLATNVRDVTVLVCWCVDVLVSESVCVSMVALMCFEVSMGFQHSSYTIKGENYSNANQSAEKMDTLRFHFDHIC